MAGRALTKIFAISFPFRSAEVRMKAATPAFISAVFSNTRYLILLSLVKTIQLLSPATLSQLISCSLEAKWSSWIRTVAPAVRRASAICFFPRDRSKSLSEIRMIYCGCAGFGQIFRSFSLNSPTIRLKRSKNLTQTIIPSWRSLISDRLLKKDEIVRQLRL